MAPAFQGAADDLIAADLDGDGDGVGDVDVLAAPRYTGTVVLYVSDAYDPIGLNECGPAVVNSTGGPAESAALGSNVLGEQSLLLRVTSLPAQSFVLFLASETPAFVEGAGGSVGNLCLGGLVGRFTGPGEVQSSGAGGTAELAVRLGAMPQPKGPVPALAGQTCRFQSWNRDVLAGQTVSNFSDAIAVTWL